MQTTIHYATEEFSTSTSPSNRFFFTYVFTSSDLVLSRSHLIDHGNDTTSWNDSYFLNERAHHKAEDLARADAIDAGVQFVELLRITFTFFFQGELS